MFEGGEFSIPVSRLSEILATLPPNGIVMVSPANQLNIYLENEWLGTIELGSEEFTVWDGDCQTAWGKWLETGGLGVKV